MTRIRFIILISISVSGCTHHFHSNELKNNFSGAEIEDLHKLTTFFLNQMCNGADGFKSCIDSIIPYLNEYGWKPILDNVDFEAQMELYEEFQSDLFSQIWKFCETRNLREKTSYRSVCINPEGKFLRFLEDLSERNPHLQNYYENIFQSGDWESVGVLQVSLYHNPENFDLHDPSIQVLIAVHYLTQNDQQKRKEIWRGNKPLVTKEL